MKRWNITQMHSCARRRFTALHRRKKMSHFNHDIHFLARELDQWLPLGLEKIKQGEYNPRCLVRYYLPDECVEQLEIPDRIFQQVILNELKPTFSHIIHPACYHRFGPSGVKRATERVREALVKEKPQYLIRADIKSFYRSIPHYKLIQDIRVAFNDEKVVRMLTHIPVTFGF